MTETGKTELVHELAERIRKMSPADQLRAAAEILDSVKDAPDAKRLGLTGIAHSLAERVVTELGAALALARLR